MKRACNQFCPVINPKSWLRYTIYFLLFVPICIAVNYVRMPECNAEKAISIEYNLHTVTISSVCCVYDVLCPYPYVSSSYVVDKTCSA